MGSLILFFLFEFGIYKVFFFLFIEVNFYLWEFGFVFSIEVYYVNLG